MNSMRISAVICTHNRAHYLRTAIQSLADQTLNKDRFEILVVDNGSTDATREVVTSEYSGVANLRYVYEPKLGHSQARNTGWQNAAGEYIAFLDDDAIASPEWLERIVDAFDTVHPKPACLGGRIDPIWEVPRPAWLPDSLVTFLAVLNYSDDAFFLKPKQYLIGANIAFTREAI